VGEVLEVQERTQDQRMGGELRTPRLPQMQRHGGAAPVWPPILVQEAGAAVDALIWYMRAELVESAQVPFDKLRAHSGLKGT
jgi:hypothetical protein